MHRFSQTPLPRPAAVNDPIVEQAMLRAVKRSFEKITHEQRMWHLITDDFVDRYNYLLRKGKVYASF